jgi:hypothetical protein
MLNILYFIQEFLLFKFNQNLHSFIYNKYIYNDNERNN